MKRNTQQHPLEARMMRIRNGFGAVEDKATLFTFAEGSFLPDEVRIRLQRGLDAFARERQAQVELELAVAQRKRLLPSLSSFCDEALVVAKRHFGGDEVKLASFGVAPRPSRKSTKRSRAGR
jgi:hypothetical protein